MMSVKAIEKIPNYHLYGDKIEGEVASFFNMRRLEESSNGLNTTAHHPHRHFNLFQIIWVTHGCGNIMIDEEMYKMEKGTLFYIHPGVVHACENSNDFKGFVLHFSPDVLLSHTRANTSFEIINMTIHNTSLVVQTNKEEKMISSSITALWKEFTNDYVEKDQIIKNHLNILMIHIQRQMHNDQSFGDGTSGNMIVKSFKKLIEQDYKKERSVSYYASLLHITPTYLNDTVKKSTGKTAGELIRERVVLEAKRLLIFSKKSISEIAFELHFEDSAYFWKFFKKYVSISPKSFREKH
ncbi:AraC family transcriptional regulator [Aquimarina macrocephali]|uniref:AraC family transcriptional regulator n=1 Tax=Aquimarina macrocephali TaxID=666563 RepID=UPI000A01C0AA|nr:helix-turn-helix transcriptional regulator [Aquimarina macrocephali]